MVMLTYSESETLEKLAGYSIRDVVTGVTGWSGSMRNALGQSVAELADDSGRAADIWPWPHADHGS